MKIDKDRVEMKELFNELVQEIEQENKLSADHPERKRFQNLLDWLKDGGSEFDKLKLRFYSENYRGVHAVRDIRGGEQVLFVPLEKIITAEKDNFKSPLCKKLLEKGVITT